MITKSKVISLLYVAVFIGIVYMMKKEDAVHIAIVLTGPLAMIWIGEWFMDNYGGSVIGMLFAGKAAFLEGKTVPVFGWFIMVFYSMLWFMIPNFTEII